MSKDMFDALQYIQYFNYYSNSLCYTVRLGVVRGYSPGFGKVEIRTGDKWSLACGSGFGITEAGVVCRELGFTDGTVPRLNYKGSSPLQVAFRVGKTWQSDTGK